MKGGIQKWLFPATLAGALAFGVATFVRAQNAAQPGSNAGAHAAQPAPQQSGADEANDAPMTTERARLRRDRPHSQHPKREKAHNQQHAARHRHHRHHHQQQ